MSTEYKTCNRCNLSQPRENFTSRKTEKDGLRKNCRNCDRVAYREKSTTSSRGMAIIEELTEIRRSVGIMRDVDVAPKHQYLFRAHLRKIDGHAKTAIEKTNQGAAQRANRDAAKDESHAASL